MYLHFLFFLWKGLKKEDKLKGEEISTWFDVKRQSVSHVGTDFPLKESNPIHTRR